MSPLVLLLFVAGYFLLLIAVAWYTSRNSNNESFFIGNRNSNWMLVAFGMIGTSLSGVTFVSVPGAVGKEAFAYFQITIGYLIGYIIVAFVLLPLYYRLNLTSIYSYLNDRLGIRSYKTGASFFFGFPNAGSNSTPLPGGKNFAGYHTFWFWNPFLGNYYHHFNYDFTVHLRRWR